MSPKNLLFTMKSPSALEILLITKIQFMLFDYCYCFVRLFLKKHFDFK